jgi:hypothetical protein
LFCVGFVFVFALDKWALAVFLLCLAKLEADCILLVHGFLCRKIVSYTWIHKDKNEVSTWKHVDGVIKIVFLTLHQD